MGICSNFFKSFLVISNDNKYIYLFLFFIVDYKY